MVQKYYIAFSGHWISFVFVFLSYNNIKNFKKGYEDVEQVRHKVAFFHENRKEEPRSVLRQQSETSGRPDGRTVAPWGRGSCSLIG